MAKEAHATDFALAPVRKPQQNIYADWSTSGGDLGQGTVGTAKGNRLPFEPALQKPGAVPFKVKGR